MHTYDDSDDDGEDDYYYTQNSRADQRRSEQQWQRDRRAERAAQRHKTELSCGSATPCKMQKLRLCEKEFRTDVLMPDPTPKVIAPPLKQC